jgi:ADP-ribose pyrophosphatase YjhB (NUDIX family)
MEKSAGIIIILKNKKILLCHSTNSKWFGSYMPPKGVLEEKESPKEAAYRETIEEIGVGINPTGLGEMHTIQYIRGKNGKTYKEVYIFEYHINDIREINLQSESIPTSMLQLEEIDDAKFMDYEEASVRILPRYNKLLELIK